MFNARFLVNNDPKLKEKISERYRKKSIHLANTKMTKNCALIRKLCYIIQNYEKYFNILSTTYQLLTKSQIGSGRISHCCCDDKNKQRNLRRRLFLVQVPPSYVITVQRMCFTNRNEYLAHTCSAGTDNFNKERRINIDHILKS